VKEVIQMNTTQKILELRDKGYGYKRIANELSLGRDHVRYRCKKKDKNPLGGICKNCGKEITSIEGKKRRVYCSDKCRYRWWNKVKESKIIK